MVLRVAFFVLAFLAAPSIASAGYADLPRHPEAFRHLQQGNRAFELARWDDAVAAYERGALLEPVPLWWRNIGAAHRAAGRAGEAIRAYQTYLRRLATDVTAEVERARVEALISELEAEASAAPAEVRPTSSTSAAPERSGGDIIVAPVQQVSQQVHVSTAAASGGGHPRLGVAIGTAGIFAGMAGAWLVMDAIGRAEDAQTEPNQRRRSDLAESAKRRRAVGVGLGVAAVGAVTAGVLVMIAPWSSPAPTVSVGTGPGDAGLSVSFDF